VLWKLKLLLNKVTIELCTELKQQLTKYCVELFKARILPVLKHSDQSIFEASNSTGKTLLMSLA